MGYKVLNNGVRMPMLGFGVYQTPPEDTERCVAEALAAGYRLIDTAQAYGNEEGVGAAIAKSGVPRDEVFVTSKIWVSNMNFERAAASIDESLRKLGTDYIDLMLLHQAMGDYPGAYRAMEDAYRAGKLRAIGVSNFYPERLVDVCALTEVPPAVNQVERIPSASSAPRTRPCSRSAWRTRRGRLLLRERMASSRTGLSPASPRSTARPWLRWCSAPSSRTTSS